MFIRNRGNPSLFLNNDNGFPAAVLIEPERWSGQWALEPVPGELVLRIRNREQNTYLHTQNGPLELSDVEPDWVAATWQIEPVEGTLFVRIRNAATGLSYT